MSTTVYNHLLGLTVLETSTDPGVSRAISASGHFINDDPKIEHQRMQATIHLMTGMVGYPIKSKEQSLVIARINEHVSSTRNIKRVHMSDFDIAPPLRHKDQ